MEKPMAFWLADTRDGQDTAHIQRFDPRFWTVNFPRPMMAAVVTTAADALRVDATFLREGDLAGLIWESRDALDHPVLGYATDRDYSRTTLSFRWRSGGVIALDAVNGPTLTIEGRDAAGTSRAWYVRLWNYAEGTPEDAQVVIDFADLAGGFLHPAEADPVHPADIDRLFVSMVAPGFAAGSTVPLTAPAEGWIELSGIACTGNRALLEIGDVLVPPHGLAAATAFDDCGNQTPARLLRNLRGLGYRGSVLHYVGMSHYMRLAADGADFLASAESDPLCTPARAWHAAFFAECAARGYSPIASLSYELLAMHCPPDWQQRAWNGDPGRTGWDPPSALLSPANETAMAWLRSVAAEFIGLMVAADVPPRFQVGEPWWWIMADGRPCLYDDAARAALDSPIEIADMRGPLNPAQKALLDAAGALLSASTAALVATARAAAEPGDLEALLLAFLPTVLDSAMPEARRANLPPGWAALAFDRLQVEDYDWLTAGADARRREGYAAVNARLGYPPAEQDYLAGFVLSGADRQHLWPLIDRGADEALARGAHEVFVWATPQICRDGYVRLPATEGDDMQAFDDIPFPLPLGLDAGVAPEFSTSVAVTASGFERRNALWSDARLRFDLGPGVRSEAELGTLIAFFRARRGAARGFRLRDPYDFSSHGMTGMPTMLDQLLGTGDGLRAGFPLVKRYGDGEDAQVRRITRPAAASIMVSVGGVSAAAWTLDAGGTITFDAAPPAGAAIRAGFLFDVPVRFAEDRLDLSGAAFAAGEAPSVPVVELREAA